MILWNLCCFHKLRDLWMGGTLRVLFIFLCCHKRNGWQRIVHYSLFFLFMLWGRKYRAWKKNCLFSLCQPWERLSAMESGRTFFFKHACKSEPALILLVLKKNFVPLLLPTWGFFSQWTSRWADHVFKVHFNTIFTAIADRATSERQHWLGLVCVCFPCPANKAQEEIIP